MTEIEGFTRTRIALDDIAMSVQQAGTGAPLILLHGFPQNGMCWGRIAPELARRFRVIVPDLRGYGQSDAPADDDAHTTYSKRRMSADIVALMDRLGLDRARIVGHDRGARVAYRLALDHPWRVDRLGIVEIVPTGDFWAAWDADLAMAAYHWTFLAQPAPLPERMIGADPVAYIDWTLASWTMTRSLDPFASAALDSYRVQAHDAARIHAMCADYRAGATIDRALDDADRAARRKISAPVHFLWAEGGFPARTGDPLGVWRDWADSVSGQSVPGCGHFVMEEAPEAVLAALSPFLER